MNSDFGSIRPAQRPQPSISPPKATRELPVEEVSYYLLTPRNHRSPVLRKAFRLWRDGWLETLKEVAGIRQLDSDEFARQDEIGILARGEEVLCVTGLRWVDMASPVVLEDSYFRKWPSEAISALGECVVGISSNTIVSPDYRRCLLMPPASAGAGLMSQPTPITAATIGLTGVRFAHSRAEKFLAVPRNDRGMNRLLGVLGGVKVGQIQVHGIDSDIIVKDRSESCQFGTVVDDLWQRCEHLAH